jgi:hypothetical protein
MMFAVKGYFMAVDAMSCSNGTKFTDADLAPGVAGEPDELFAGQAWFFKGHIDVVHTLEGAMQAKGEVEYVVDYVPNTVPRGTRRRSLLADIEKPAVAPATPAPAKQPEIKAAPTTPQQPQQAAAAQPAPAKPATEQPKPATEQPKAAPVKPAEPAPAKPATEQPKPAAAKPAEPAPAKPATEQPKPAVEQPKPAEQPKTAPAKPAEPAPAKPAAEQPKPAATEPAPAAKPTTPEQPKAAAAEPKPSAEPTPAAEEEEADLQVPLAAPVVKSVSSRAAAFNPNSLLGLRAAGGQRREGSFTIAPKISPEDGPKDAPIVREGNLQIIFYNSFEK